MGRDKALIEIDGTALVTAAVIALRDAGADPVIVVGGDKAGIEALGLDQVRDTWPGDGPLGGIISALRVLDADVVVILSCDLTDASPVAVSSVVGALGDADVAIPVIEGQPQWLHAAWRRAALSTLEAAFAAGVRAPRDAAQPLRVAHLLDGDPCWFHDADSPHDLPPGAR